MSQFALYLLKMSLCSGVLYGYYHLALRNRVFHQYNRFYLLAAVLFSLLFPLIPLPQIYSAAQPADPIQLYNLLRFSGGESEVVVPAPQNWNWHTAIVVLYITVCLVLISRLVAGLLQIRRLMMTAEVQYSDKIKFVSTDHAAAPFSFFNWLFWKEEIALESESGQSIFRHELVHIHEKHTIDKLFLQTILIFLWINPFFWLVRRELQMIHEFIADKKAVGQQGAAALAAMILQAANCRQYQHLTNAFFQQPIKRRLAMLQKTLSHPQNAYLGRVLALPLCALLLFAFARKENKNTAPVALEKTITVLIDAGHGGEDDGARGNGYTEKELALELAKSIAQVNNNPKINLVFTRTGDEYPPLKERVAMTQKTGADLFVSLHMMSTEGVVGQQPKDFKGEGFEVSISGKNKTWQHQSSLLGSALIQHLSTVYNTRPDLLVHKTPGVWVLDANTVPAVLIECGYISSGKDLAFITKKENREVIARKILAAIEAYAQQTELQTKPINDTIPEKANSENIKEVRVDKKDSVSTITIIYKDGKTETLTDKQAREKKLLIPPPPPPSPSITSKALYVIDGVEMGTAGGDERLKEIDPNNIETITVLKDEHAIKRYGQKGKNGVVEIKTKKGATTTFRSLSEKGDIRMEAKEIIVQSNRGDTSFNKALLIIDGKEQGMIGDGKKLHAINPTNIESITVLKDEHASEKYGEKGKNGVIEIITKKEGASSLVPRQGANIVHIEVEQPPYFPGGKTAWQAFLGKNLKPSIPVDNGAPAGTYNVEVQFKITNDGTISDIQPAMALGYGMEKAVVALMQKSPKWVPAEQNGHKVTALHKQKVTFVVAEE